MPVEPSTHIIPSGEVVSFTILVENQEINSAYQIMSIAIIKEFNRIAHAEIKLLDGSSAAQDFEISNSDDFIVGKNVEIKVGYHGENTSLFKGVIIRHGIKIIENEGSCLNITLKNKAYKSTLVRNNNVFSHAADSDIIREIISRYGLDNEVEATDVRHESLMQFNCADWDFINMRAEANAQLVYTADDKIIVKKPDLSAATMLTLQYGATMLEFEADLDGRTSYSNYKASSWNFQEQELKAVEQASDTNELAQGNLTAADVARTLGQEQFNININTSLSDENEINKLTDSFVQKNNLSRINGRVKSFGIPGVQPGDIIELRGVGARFNGRAFVTGVYHAVDGGLWHTDIQFGLNGSTFAEKYDNIVERQANGMLPAVNGLQTAKVERLEGDPLGEDRILIFLPVFPEGENTFWARIATLDAGNRRGTFFRPEIGDEVVVGFIDDNPNNAVILGMMNSSALPAPITARDANNTKGIYTREGMKLEFDDDKKSVRIESPQGNKVNLSEQEQGIVVEDQNGNKITMDTGGIKLEDLHSNKVTLDSNGLKMQNSAGGEVSLTASGIKIMSPGTVEIQGAQLQITGAMVTLDSAMVKVSGVVQTTAVIATSVVGTTYTPGAGNVW